MNTQSNRLDVLKMVESGELSPADAAAKLAGAQPAVKPVSSTGRPRWLRVRVTTLSTGKPKVTVNLPMTWVQVGLSLGSRFAPQVGDLDWKVISDALNDEQMGQLVEVEDEEKDERVQVFTE